MFKLLRVRIHGYRSVRDGEEIVLVNRARVQESEKEEEILPIDDNLYSFRLFAAAGKNSSGKSTFLSSLALAYFLLRTGRLSAGPLDFRGPRIQVESAFYLDGDVFFHKASFLRPSAEAGLGVAPLVESEELRKISYGKRRGKNILSFEPNASDAEEMLGGKAIGDTCAVARLTGGSVFFDFFMNNNTMGVGGGAVCNTFFDVLRRCDPSFIRQDLRVLDPGIEELRLPRPGERNAVLKREGRPRQEIPFSDLFQVLSSGTIRGTELFARIRVALENGSAFLLDEIEDSFHKSLISLVLSLFASKEMNPRGAQLFFTTHLTECLDQIARKDAIFVCVQEKGEILFRNLHGDFKVRNDVLRSNQFDNGCLGTGIPYESRAALRRMLTDGL